MVPSTSVMARTQTDLSINVDLQSVEQQLKMPWNHLEDTELMPAGLLSIATIVLLLLPKTLLIINRTDA